MSERFSLVVPLNQLRDGERIDLVAGDDEREAIARRLGLVSLASLKAHAAIRCGAERITAEGRVQGRCEQSCVATGDPVAAAIDEPFTLAFVPEPAADPDAEFELGGDDLDTVFHDGASIPLGEALVDIFALALDPYPRSAGADATLKEAGVMSEEEASPFAALASLKDKLLGGNAP